MQVVFLVEGTDLDALSSAYSYTLLNEESFIYLPFSYNKSTKLALNIFKDLLENLIIKKEQIKTELIKKAVFVDTSSLRKIVQTLENLNLDIKNIDVLVIDHHPKKLEHSKIKTIKTQTGACTTYFVEKIKEKNINLSKRQATLIALGIYEDTGSFKYTGTTERDFLSVAYLSKFGLDFDIINHILTKRFDEKTINILEKLIEQLHILYVNKYKIGISYVYTTEFVPDISTYINNIKEFSLLDAIFLIISTKNKNFIIGRSKTDKIDVSRILSFFAGGGHKRAGSAIVKDFTTVEIVNFLQNIIFATLEKNKKIKDILNKNFCIIKENQSIKDINFKNNSVCIVVDENGNFSGIILSKIVKQSIKHGIKDITAKDLAIDDIYTFSTKTYISEAEPIIHNSSQEWFPVLENGKPVGIVSKTDIVKALYSSAFETEKDIFISRQKLIPKHYNFEAKINAYFDKEILNILKHIGHLAKQKNMKVYIVGGIVRDIIMGNKNLDIDLIVEGDAIELAKMFSEKNRYIFHKFEEFLTATVKIRENLKIDFATARKETYEYPGAYPKVEKATIKEDLYRRDFTINTLAIDITEGDFGILLDYFNGYKDIKDKVIRILHQLSFIEDPIRILRAVRFAGRFDFKIGNITEKLLKIAIDQRLLDVAPTGRINLELNLTFNEEKVIQILKLMDKYKILSSLIPMFTFNEERKIFIEKLKDNIILFENFFNQKIEKSIVYFISLVYHLPLEIAYETMKKYHFENTFKYLKTFNQVKNQLHKDQKNSQIYKIIKNLKPEVIVLLLSYKEENISKNIIKVLKEINNKKFIISGKDLKKYNIKPSPKFGQIIEDIFIKYLDGILKTKQDIENYIKEIAKNENTNS